MNSIYNEMEKDWVRKNCGKMKDEELLKKFNKKWNKKITLNALRKLRLRLGIEKKQGRGYVEIVRNGGPKIKKARKCEKAKSQRY